MSYSPYAHTTATTAHVGLLKLGTGVNADASGGLVTTSVPNGVTTGGSYSDPIWLTLSKSKVGLSNVENTALSTWVGSTAITALGTVTTGSAPASDVSAWAKAVSKPSYAYSEITSAPSYTDWTSWTPSFSSGLGTGGITKSFYSRIGNVVHFYVNLTSNSNNSGSFALPFTSVDWATGKWAFRTTANTYPQAEGSWIITGAACFFDQLAASSLAAGDLFIFSGTFRV
jgi:hypothetical protein